MKRRRLAAVANFHRERRLGAKTARFLAACQRNLAGRGVDFLIEFVLDRPDEETERRISAAAEAIPGARLHRLEVGDLGASRAHGVRAARAEVVCFIDGDDFFSLDWFESALDALSGERRREIVHTQYLVAFGEERFIRETVDSRDPSFDPLSLAVDWYWNGNLALQTWLFHEIPIETYDHDAGFGSEDWHWACNTLAAGVHRVVIPGACYYYRIKPAKLALGRVGEVIHKRAALYEPRSLPPPPAMPLAKRPPIEPPSPAFFARAREIEPFELGVSWVRALEAGAVKVQQFKPHTPPLVGEIVRGVLANGFGDGSTVVFADEDRLPGGLARARGLASAFAPAGKARAGGRLYVVEGDATRSGPLPDGYAIAARELREVALNLPRRHRLIARFLVQAADLTVVNLLSPRRRSLALGYHRATRGSVARWINVVTEYGSDPLSQAWEEIEAFADAGIDAETVAIFAKTAEEAAAVRGLQLARDPRLEAAWVDGSLGERPAVPRLGASAPINPLGFVRLALRGGDPFLSEEEAAALRAASAKGGGCVVILGGARPGWAFREPGWSEPGGPRAGLLIPAITVIGQGEEPNFTLVHPLQDITRRLTAGALPASLFLAGAIGLDAAATRIALQAGERDVGALLRASLASARRLGRPLLAHFAPASTCYMGRDELARLDVAVLTRRVAGPLPAP